MARPTSPAYPPEFEASYQEVFVSEDGVAIPKAQREAAKREAFLAWKLNAHTPEPPIEEDPIALPTDTAAEALEKIVGHSLRTMTPSDAVKHRSQLLKFAGDTVLADRKAKIEKQAMASGLSIITELFRQAAAGQVKQGPGWIDATVLPTLSAQEQAEQAVDAAEALETQREAV